MVTYIMGGLNELMKVKVLAWYLACSRALNRATLSLLIVNSITRIIPMWQVLSCKNQICAHVLSQHHCSRRWKNQMRQHMENLCVNAIYSLHVLQTADQYLPLDWLTQRQLQNVEGNCLIYLPIRQMCFLLLLCLSAVATQTPGVQTSRSDKSQTN